MAPGGNRLLTIGAAAGSLVLLAAVVFILWPPDPVDQAVTEREQSDGEMVGWVSKVEGNRIHVNAGPFGGGVLSLEVTKHTRITAGAKEGWFEDIRLGGQVKVAYELHNGRRLARTVELLVDDGPRRPIRTEPRVKSTGVGPATERVPAKPSVATTTTPDARPGSTSKAAEPSPATPPAKAKAPEPVPGAPPVVTPPASAPTGSAKPASPAAPEVRPASKPEPTRLQPAEIPPPQRASTPAARSTAAVENSARAQETPRPPAPLPAAPASGGRVAEPVRPQEIGDSSDGSAAVDWFLKGRR
ncbi:MAG TPA: hypothetical protein VFS98_15140 [Methylomirabilota bacterium]|nr:hypothetical protein [Methylomirabilota bacterium]